MSIRITAKMLVDMDACLPQVERFKSLYPKGLTIKKFTIKAIEDLANEGLDTWWIMNQFDPEESNSREAVSEMMDLYRLYKSYYVDGKGKVTVTDPAFNEVCQKAYTAIRELADYDEALRTFQAIERLQKLERAARKARKAAEAKKVARKSTRKQSKS